MGIHGAAKHALVPLIVVVVVVLVPTAAVLVHGVHHMHLPLEFLEQIRSTLRWCLEGKSATTKLDEFLKFLQTALDPPPSS